ncbi:MAG: 2-C-methyl-D-erythritol 4-phosphate cytidylyltransferase [Armatimonadetes bacterium CG07_land_8_20_14_0_80_40_9]|nr:MAG: 2-C-methyl-D-erythritol 4-phosphate cytidylyltransferase [Armatimonadetes bacterium CG07_land_8_20_14_0_80_40_9]
MERVSVVIPAAGEGKRFKGYSLRGVASKGAGENKLFLPLLKLPLLVRTLKTFANYSQTAEIILVSSSREITNCKDLVKRYKIEKVKKIIPGGKSRQSSVFKGLKALAPETNLVVIHDGDRPLVTKEIIRRVIYQARKQGAATAGVPVKDTIKVVEEKKVIKTLKRRKLWLIQTPQVFKSDLILKAHQRAKENKFLATDDAMLVERIGHSVGMALGSYENIKITTQEDLLLAEAILIRRS